MVPTGWIMMSCRGCLPPSFQCFPFFLSCLSLHAYVCCWVWPLIRFHLPDCHHHLQLIIQSPVQLYIVTYCPRKSFHTHPDCTVYPVVTTLWPVFSLCASGLQPSTSRLTSFSLPSLEISHHWSCTDLLTTWHIPSSTLFSPLPLLNKPFFELYSVPSCVVLCVCHRQNLLIQHFDLCSNTY